jgi:hypothetical protein
MVRLQCSELNILTKKGFYWEAKKGLQELLSLCQRIDPGFIAYVYENLGSTCYAMEPVPVILDPGDVLFFNGQVVHGSFPNRSTHRFRSSMIAHYVSAEDESVSQFFHPVYRMDDSEIDFGVSEQGAPCGEWAEQNGQPIPVMTSRMEEQRR